MRALATCAPASVASLASCELRQSPAVPVRFQCVCDCRRGSTTSVIAQRAARRGVASITRPSFLPPKNGEHYCVFVALEEAAAVAIVAEPPWRLIGTTPVAPGPRNLEARDGRYVAVTSPASDTVTVIRSSDGKRLATAVIAGYRNDLVFTPAGKHLWVTAEQGEELVELTLPTARGLPR